MQSKKGLSGIWSWAWKLGAAAAAFAVISCSGPKLADGLYAQLDTAKGQVIISLEYKKAPLTVTNFVGLAEGTLGPAKGKPYYDGLTFHRVVKDFVVQSGDPTGTGGGGPGYTIPDEIAPDLKHDAPGVVAMANRGPNTNGSQFYITTVAAPWLDGHYSIFGHVVQGMDIVTTIVQGDVVKHLKILRVGTEAKAFKADQASFDALLAATQARIQQAAEQKAAADAALAKEKWPKATESPDGVRYIIEKRGAGTRTPKLGSEVTVNYTGTLLDGTKFDSTYDTGKPATFKVGDVIAGWNDTLIEMKKGEKRLVIIPPKLGYGDRGFRSVIPPNSTLVFEIELLDFK